MGFGKWFDAILMGIVEGLTSPIPVWIRPAI